METLYIVGDLVDVWQLRRGIYWPQEHNDVIQKILRKARKGTRVIYIPGNHDEFVAGFIGDYGNITLQQQAIHTTADGRRILVMHGHELDAVVQSARWLAFAGDIGYQFLLSLNPAINFVRRLLRPRLLVAQRLRQEARQGRRQLHRRVRESDRALCRAGARSMRSFAAISTTRRSGRSAPSLITTAATGWSRAARSSRKKMARSSC